MKIILSDNKTYKILIISFEIILILLVLFTMINRVKYGVDFSDESWYVAEPYAVAEMGAVPLVDNVTQSPGFTIPLAFAFKLFCILNGGTEGIVFFSRLLFIIVSFLVACTTFYIIKRYTLIKMPIIIIIPLFLASNTGYSLYAVNYHTIGLIYLPLIIALIFAEYDDNSRKSFIWGLLAGFVAVRAVLGTVQIIIALFVFFVVLCLQKKFKRIAGILTGWFLTWFIIICTIGVKYGFESFFLWVKMYLNQGYFLIGNLWNFRRSVKGIKLLFKYAVKMFILLGVIKLLTRKKIFESFLIISVLSLITIGIVFSIRKNDHYEIILSRFSWFLPILYGLYTTKKNFYNKPIMIIYLAYLSVYFSVSYTTASGFGPGKAYWLFAPILLTIIMLYNYCIINLKDKLNSYSFYIIIKCWIICIILLLGAFKIWAQYSYVYRDDNILLLSNRVDKGIWKGLYTTEQRKKCILGVEDYLKKITNEEDYVLCLDWVSFGYLMVNGRICSPTTFDASHYSYNINTPNPYYMYFAVVNRVPNKIIYIDYGHDKIISIDNPEWKFNIFVNSFYQEQNRFSNELFKVREYVILNQENALKMVKEEAIFD